MGLMRSVRRYHYVYAWRLRYWWMDTQGGAQARIALICLAALVAIIELINAAVAALAPPPPGQPAKAILWIIVQLIIAIVSAIISAALAPKPKAPTPQTASSPTTEDGQTVKHYFGEGWVEDEFILAWKQMGTVPIKAKGGKK